ncbi:MAG: EF-hand domain-containing protein [Acidobacteriota bacterium]
MRPGNRYAAVLALALALGGPGCTATNQTGQARAVETSYPSPDYPATAGSGQPNAVAPAPQAGAKLAERPLATPPPAAVNPAPAPAAGKPTPVAPVVAPSQAGRFAAMDADHNGRITLEEWRAFQEREFRRLDANDDGVISREEMDAPPRATAVPAARPRP